MSDTELSALPETNAENTSAIENTVASPVRKRGRPSNPNKVVKVPSGRGRGRPKKYEDGEERPAYTNTTVPREPYSGRGRPRKLGKRKISQTIVATGKGRGRPKTLHKTSVAFNLKKLGSLKKTTKVKGQRGRPKKASSSDDEEEGSNDGYEDEKRPVGRPSTGAVSLNIVATGRGQGRPKKNAVKRPISSNNEDGSPRKRGRPSLGKTVAKPKSDKPRGRPKKITSEETTEANENGNDSSE